MYYKKTSENLHFDKLSDRFRVISTRKMNFSVAEPVEA